MYIDDDGNVTLSTLWRELVPLARELAGLDPKGDADDNEAVSQVLQIKQLKREDEQ